MSAYKVGLAIASSEMDIKNGPTVGLEKAPAPREQGNPYKPLILFGGIGLVVYGILRATGFIQATHVSSR